MLKSKKSIFILLPINIFIWGFIGYKIYTALNDDENILPTEISVSKIKKNKNDSTLYVLDLNYEDPFLKEEPKYIKQQTTAKSIQPPPSGSNKAPKKPVKTEIIPAKEIKYLGLIQNKTSGASTALISINGTSHVVRKGETVEGLVIKSISDTEIAMKDGKSVLSIKKN